jgi:type IV pilus assembly protein PilB
MVMMKRDVGDLCVTGKLITPEQLVDVREFQARAGGDLGDILVQQGLITSIQLLQARAHLHGLKPIDVATTNIDVSAVNVVPSHVARRHTVMPILKQGDGLVVAVADPTNVLAIDELKTSSGLKVQLVLGDKAAIEEVIAKHYGGGDGTGSAAATSPERGMADINSALAEYKPTGGQALDAETAEALKDEVQAPIIRIAHTIIQQAITDAASDIHVEPGLRHVRIRFRIDGVLHEVMTLPRHIHPPLISRYKIMSEMNIAERRVPQDGRIGINFNSKDFDLRVSCLPTMLGEKIVMRILDKSSVMLGLNKLGFFPDTMAQLESIITQPNGMILSTGPTGAGKTTTQYSVLNRINTVELNILTIEDPVEYQLPGVSQVHVNRKAGLTFATALRSFMRQDPDIIMVGEIRDLETAEMAIQASLTGHLVLSTLHTNDAPSTVTRLVDMGVEPFLISATLIGALAQRLGRRVCERCKQQYEVSAGDLRAFGFIPDNEDEKIVLWRGRGCDACRQTGYKGRIGIYELMLMNEEIAELVVRRAPLAEVKQAARANGMITLQEDGLRKVLQGYTTPEEVRRVVFTAGH